MGTLRSKEEWVRYEKYKLEGGLEGRCGLCERESLKEFSGWRIIQNEFPYDNIAKVHHMILPKRHVTELGLSEEEIQELRLIKENYLHEKYEFLIEATHRKKSIPGHFHVHLIIAKD